MADVFLDSADRLPQLLCNRLSTQRLHVEVVGPCRKNHECNDRRIAVL